MIALTTIFFFAEIVVGYGTNSMALVADSFHMLSDVVSLFVGFFALKVNVFIGCLIVNIYYAIYAATIQLKVFCRS